MARLSNETMEHRLFLRGLAALLEGNNAFKRLMFTILEQGATFATTHAPGHPDHSAFAEGRRSLALEVLSLLQEAEPRALPILWDASLLQKVATSQPLNADNPNAHLSEPDPDED